MVSQSTGGCGRHPRPSAASRTLQGIHGFPSEFAPCSRPRLLALAGLPFVKPLLGASAIPDIGADEYSYTGTGALFGTTGFSSYDLIPHMATSNTSFVAGSPLTLNLTNAVMPVFGVAAPFAILLMGTSSLPGPGLPFALSTLGCTGSWNWTNSLVWTSVVPIASAGAGIGTASLTLSTPSAIAGSIFTFQWFVIAPTSYPCVTTEGIRVHF